MIGQTISHYRIVEKLGGGGMGVVYKAEDTELGVLSRSSFCPTMSRETRRRWNVSVVKLGRLRPEPSQHLHNSTRSARRRPVLHRHGVFWMGDAEAPDRRPSSEMEDFSRWPSRSPMRWMPLTRKASFIGTSSPRTFRHQTRARQDSGLRTGEGQSGEQFFKRSIAVAQHATALERGASDQSRLYARTIAYMSPEQARAKELDARSDLFSFGAVIYEMATGQLPFRGESTATIFDSILNRAPVRRAVKSRCTARTGTHHQ